MTPHSALRSAILAAAQKADPKMRAFGRVSGLFRDRFSDRIINVGISGQADIYGFKLTTARHFEIECKVAGDTMSQEQLAWQAFCVSAGIPHLVAHAKNVADIPRAAAEAAQWIRSL